MKKQIKIILIGILMMIFAVNIYSDRIEDYKQHKEMQTSSLFKEMKWEGIGPYFMGGRITDIEGYNDDSNKFLVATASGGLWITGNNGTTWQPLFDNESSITIGDIAISQTNDQLIWVGTGEENSSRSSYAGTGVFKSTNGGKSWSNMGLYNSHHISEILIHPQDNSIVYVAVLGHLYTYNEVRGVFKTIDGGKTWNKIFYINDKTGVIDLVMHPKNPDILFAATWERERKAWNFVESGLGSSIYKSEDGGKTWKEKVKGFLQDDKTGRIGLAIARSNPDVIYAFLDNQTPRPEKKKKPAKDKNKSGITVDKLEKMTVDDFLKIDNRKLTLFLKENDAPENFTPEIIKEYVKKGMVTLKQMAFMMSRKDDANTRLLNSKVLGAEVYKSEDGGEKWVKTHKKMMSRNIVSTYGYYFGQIYVSPENKDIIYILGIPLMRSVNGGKSFETIPKNGGSYGTGLFDVHPDHQALWIDPNNPKKIINGNDGGLNISYDRGDTFTKVNNLPLAQCYTVHFDTQKPYYIYTGLQDNGINMGPSNFKFKNRYPLWRMILGGDGAFVQPEPDNPNIVYAEFQFGSIFRLDIKNPSNMKSIKPQPKSAKDKSYRFNWLSPFKISKHNPYTLYMGANKLLKSVDRGDHWMEISKDLTNNKNTNGDVPYATITAIDESTFTPEILYAGTDDGNLWVTGNAGKNWQKITDGLPEKWITRVVASKFKKERVYVTLTGYREDDFKTYLYKSEDFGKTWKSIKSNLPDESVNVIREDPAKENILYLGTDLAPYVSLDQGKTWHSLKCNLPTNAVYDLKVHPIAHDLIIGTHGRGVFILENLEYIQKLDQKIMDSLLHIFDIKDGRLSQWQPRNAKIIYFSKQNQEIKLMILDRDGKKTFKTTLTANQGINVFSWDLKAGKKPVKKGNYQVILTKDKTQVKGQLKVK